MPRDPRPLFVLAIMGGLVLLILAAAGPFVVGRGKPMDLLPADDGPPSSNGLHVRPLDEADDPAIRAVAGELIESFDLSGLTPARLR